MIYVTKIIWGINIPVLVTAFKGWDKKSNDYVYEPCICHKTFSFELCNVCGEQVTEERLKSGLTTCSPECSVKKWDSNHSLVITREREKKGIRPSRFWEIIKSECFRRDNHTCCGCKKSEEELLQLMESETGIDEKSHNKGKKSDYILNVHHVVPIKTGGDNTPDNLITLCGKCHKKEHSTVANIKRKHLSLDFFGIESIDPVGEEG
jgi:5-methylcytosine-specific restriction endonuclease McrA